MTSTSGSLLALAALAALAPGCIAVTARAHVGPTVSSDGVVDVQGGIALGFGYPPSDESAVTGALGAATGSRNSFELTDTIEYLSVPDDGVGQRLGITAQIPIVGDFTTMSVHGGLTHTLRRRHRSGGHEKSFQTSTTTVLAVGARLRAGLMTRHREGADSEFLFAGGADLTLDWLMLSRVR